VRDDGGMYELDSSVIPTSDIPAILTRSMSDASLGLRLWLRLQGLSLSSLSDADSDTHAAASPSFPSTLPFLMSTNAFIYLCISAWYALFRPLGIRHWTWNWHWH